MKEILFRGKRVDNGEWVYGDFTHGNERKTLHDAIWEYCPETQNFLPYDITTSTVGQHTGLADKNGVKIFEGDIVDLFGMKGTIVQECGAFGISFDRLIDYNLLESKIPCNNSPLFTYNDNFISLWELWWNYEQDDNPLYEVEVIGNIHDNPELLKEN